MKKFFSLILMILIIFSGCDDGEKMMQSEPSPIIVTFGTIVRKLNDEDYQVIHVPLTLSEAVTTLRLSNFLLATTSGDGVAGIADYKLYGSGRSYELRFTFDDEKEGVFTITAQGEVGSAESLTSPIPASVSYATHIPKIVDTNFPPRIVPGENFDVAIAWNFPVTELGTDDFIYEGVDIGMPTLYIYTGTETIFRNLLPIPDILPGGGWVESSNPTREDSWDVPEQAVRLAEEGQFFVLRFSPPLGTPQGTFNLKIKANSVRGPDES